MKRCPHCGGELPPDDDDARLAAMLEELATGTDLDALLDELGGPPDLDLPPPDLDALLGDSPDGDVS